MNMYIYKQDVRGEEKVVVCLELSVSTLDTNSNDFKINNSKIHKLKLKNNDKIINHWNWVSGSKEHIFLINNTQLPEKIASFTMELIDSAIIDMFKISDKPLFLSLTRNDLYNKYGIDDNNQDLLYRVKMEENYILFKAFIYFNENPDFLEEFPIFREFVLDNKLENYEVEDWLSDMEENILYVY